MNTPRPVALVTGAARRVGAGNRDLILAAYRDATAGTAFVPQDSEQLRRVLRVFELEKAIYELGYEMNNRPDWIWVPVAGITQLTGGMV